MANHEHGGKIMTVYAYYGRDGTWTPDNVPYYASLKPIGKVVQTEHVGFTDAMLSVYKERQRNRILQIGTVSHEALQRAADPLRKLASTLRFAKTMVLRKKTKSRQIYEVAISRQLTNGPKPYVKIDFLVHFSRRQPTRHMVLRSDRRGC